MTPDFTPNEAADLQDALVELQAASWSRSWSRVKAARKRVKTLLGIDVPGPLTHAQGKALAVDGGSDALPEPGQPGEPKTKENRIVE